MGFTTPTGRRWLGAALFGLGALLLAGTAHAVVPGESHDARSTTPAPATAPGDALGKDIVKQQAEVRRTPRNATAWASLALDYVQQAKVTVNPVYYPKAEEATARSLAIDSTGNANGYAARAALAAARHDFRGARDAARTGLRIDAYDATLLAALNDASTQLGLYAEARRAAERLNRLSPGVPAFTRISYAFELRGDTRSAEVALERALAVSSAPADQAFVRYYLGELAFGQGDARAALAQFDAGLSADPRYFALRQGKAKAEAALGRVDAALRDYRAVVAAVPQPEYVVEFGDYLTSLGRTSEAKEQYAVFAAENALFEANGVALDTDPTLYYADHGQPARAMRYARAGIAIRPFVEMDDAYAWALHASGRDAEARSWSRKALRLGTRNALFHFHAGMIEKALGNRVAARAQLRKALAINPHFSPVHVPQARAALRSL